MAQCDGEMAAAVGPAAMDRAGPSGVAEDAALDRLARIAALATGAEAVEIAVDASGGGRLSGRFGTAAAPRTPWHSHRADGWTVRLAGAGPQSGTDWGPVAPPAPAGALLAEIAELALDTARLATMAGTDTLTGAATRAVFVSRLGRRLAGASRSDAGPVALLMIDVDRFKRVNDRFGHAAGDAALRAVAARLRAGLREADLMARIGGEEFCIALSATPADAARAVAERLRRRVAASPVETPAGPVRVTISVGVAVSPVRDPAEAMAAADRALYRAKRAGRDRVATLEAAETVMARPAV